MKAILTRLQKSADNSLDELAAQNQLQKVRHNELVHMQNCLLTQKQSMVAMMSKFQKSVNPNWKIHPYKSKALVPSVVWPQPQPGC